MDPENALKVMGFFNNVGVSDTAVDAFTSVDSYSTVLCDNLKPISVDRGRVSCFLTVKPSVSNYFGGLHGGATAAVAERVAIACARTVVAEDKELFLGELSMAYLSAAPKNAELIVDGSVVRSGRNLTVVAVEFKMKDSAKLVSMTRATFYNSPVSKL